MFAAYAEDSPPSRIAPREEENDFSGRYGSFVSRSTNEDELKLQQEAEDERRKQEKKARREKKLNKEHLLSVHSIKVIGIDSDDDSEVEIPLNVSCSYKVSKKRSKKRSSKKKRKRRRRSRSSSYSNKSSTSSSSTTNTVSSSSEGERNSYPSVPQILCGNERWSFMVKFDPSNSKSFMMMDLKGDRSNTQYNSLCSADIASYDFPIKKILNGDEKLERLRFGTREKRDTMLRYFSDKVRRTWKENPERLWRKKELKPSTDYIELSLFALSEDHLKDESGNLSMEKCSAVQDGLSLIEATPAARSRNLNLKLRNNQYNVELWLKFLALQDEVYLAQDDPESRAKTKADRLTSRELLERKMSILDKAISLNHKVVKLKLERLKVGLHLWDDEVWNIEMRNVEFKHVNDPEMWKGILDILESDTRRFNLAVQLKKMKICLEKLEEVRSGKLLSHKLLPNTEQFMASVILRRIHLLWNCGYIEKAIATSQAICEFNFCIPDSFKNAELEDKRKLFETFWDSGIARIGDEGAEGWADSIGLIKEGKATTDVMLFEKQQADYDKAELDLCSMVGSEGLKMPYRLVWIEIERLRTQYHWRPIRDLNAKFEDTERIVTFQDIEDVLYVLDPHVAVDLLYNILEEFGAIIYGRNSMLSTNIMQQFIIFPDLSLRLKDFDKFVSRFFELSCKYVREERELLLSSQLLTYLNFLKMDHQLSDKMQLKRFREVAKNLCRKDNNVNNASFMATFAEKMYELGDKQTAKICVSKFFTGDLWSESGSTRIMSMLRMAIVYIHAVDDEVEKRRLIASFIMEGKPVDVTVNEPREIEKRMNIRINNLLTNNYLKQTWEGSAIDLTASLTLLFAYYFADDHERVHNLKTCFTVLSGTMKTFTLRIFTKTYVELLQMHIMSHPCEPPRLLTEASAMAHEKYPTDISFLKMFIDCNAVGTRIVHLRRFLENNVEDQFVNYCRAFGSVYLELLRHRVLLEKNDIQSPELHRLRATLMNSSERISHRDDVFWRLLLWIENERKDFQRSSEVFYLAYAGCPWSKALILDYKNVKAGEHEKLLDALVEKKLRVRCEREEIALLIQ